MKLPVAARGVSQRRAASRCGSESERGTRLAVEAISPSREPVASATSRASESDVYAPRFDGPVRLGPFLGAVFALDPFSAFPIRPLPPLGDAAFFSARAEPSPS